LTVKRRTFISETLSSDSSQWHHLIATQYIALRATGFDCEVFRAPAALFCHLQVLPPPLLNPSDVDNESCSTKRVYIWREIAQYSFDSSTHPATAHPHHTSAL
jgi:hypothetical protein